MFRPTKGKLFVVLAMLLGSYLLLIFNFHFSCFAVIGECPPPSFAQVAINAIVTFPGAAIGSFLINLFGSSRGYLPAELQGVLFFILIVSYAVFYYALVCVFNPYFYRDLSKNDKLILKEDAIDNLKKDDLK